MATVYKWAIGDRPLLSTMVTTSLLGDGGVGDTSTGVSDTQVLTFGRGCRTTDTTAAVSVLADMGCLSSVQSVSLSWDGLGSLFNHPADPEDIEVCVIAPGPAGYSETVTLEYATNSAGPWTVHSTWTSAAQTPQNVTVTPGVNAVYFRAVAVASYQTYASEATQTSSITITDFRVSSTLLVPQTAPTLAAQGACEGAQNGLTWTSVLCSTGYEIEVNGSATTIDAGNVLAYAHAPVTIGTPYSYRVRAYNTVGVGPWSAAQVWTPCTVPAAPTTSTTAQVLATCEGPQCTLWMVAPVMGAESYRVRVYAASLPASGVVVYDGVFVSSLAPFVLEGLLYAPYELTVQSYNGVGDGPEGARFSFTPCRSGCECGTWVETDCRG